MEIVRQKEPTGCGLASVAMVSGRTYQQVKEFAISLGIVATDTRLYSDTGYVRQLLAKYGIRVSGDEKPFTTWNALPNKALLAINYRIEHGQPSWHWVVFCCEHGASVVLDPAQHLSNNKRTDFEDMQPKWFIEILNT